MNIRYMGLRDHSAMFDKEYIFLGSGPDMKNQNKIYEVPYIVGSFLCSRYPEDVNKANMSGIIFKEVKKK